MDLFTHISDFGLAKYLSDHLGNTTRGTQSSSTGIKGTVGYVSPGNSFVSNTNLDLYNIGFTYYNLMNSNVFFFFF